MHARASVTSGIEGNFNNNRASAITIHAKMHFYLYAELDLEPSGLALAASTPDFKYMGMPSDCMQRQAKQLCA